MLSARPNRLPRTALVAFAALLCAAPALADDPPKAGGDKPVDAPADKTQATGQPAAVQPPDAPKGDQDKAAGDKASGDKASGDKAPGDKAEKKDDKGGAPRPGDITRASDFMDTRITWTFGDDDVTKATGKAFPLSPNPNASDRPQYRLFFDNLNSRFAGRENLTHLVLYKKVDGFIPNVVTDAALVLRVDIGQMSARTNNVNSAFYDSGSYLRVFYRTGTFETADGKKRDTGLDLVFFPLDTDRFRLGYLYDISWGGTAQSINQSIFPRLVGSAPGAKFQYSGERFYVFAGFKTAQISQPEVKVGEGAESAEFTRIQETNYGFLGGGGVDFTDNIRLDVGGGYFTQGKFENPGVAGKQVYTYGASSRLVLHDDMPVPASVDFALYRNDPNAPMVIFRPETYNPGQFAWAFSAEGSYLAQNLVHFERPNATKIQPAVAAAGQATVKYGYLRAQLTGIFRDLAFVLRNQPSFIPFETMPDKAKLDPEMFFAFAADYFIESLHLTPGIGAGLQLPATFSSDATDKLGNEIGRTVVVRQQGNLSSLPENKTRVPIIQARLSLKWDLSKMMAAILWGQVVRDNNGTRLERAEDGTTLQRSFVAPDFIGFGTSLQARF